MLTFDEGPCHGSPRELRRPDDPTVMDYAEALDAFFRSPPEGTPPPRTQADRTPARRLRDAIEPLAMVSVWSAEAQARYADLGLDFLSGYVFSRAAPLGVAPVELVVASFGVFSPGVVGSAYETGLASCSHAEVLAARVAGTVEAFHRLLGPPPPEVEQVVAALRRGLERAEPTARPLFAGQSALDWPGDAWGRLWHATTLLREYRGDGHLAACVAAGLDPVAMNLLTELHVGITDRSYTATRGWSEAEIDGAVERLARRGVVDGSGALTARGRALRDGIEAATDTAVDDVVLEIGGEIGGESGGLDAVTEQCERWADAVVEAGSFPPDPYKRAAG